MGISIIWHFPKISCQKLAELSNIGNAARQHWRTRAAQTLSSIFLKKKNWKLFPISNSYHLKQFPIIAAIANIIQIIKFPILSISCFHSYLLIGVFFVVFSFPSFPLFNTFIKSFNSYIYNPSFFWFILQYYYTSVGVGCQPLFSFLFFFFLLILLALF